MSVLFMGLGDSVMMALATLLGPFFICIITSRAAAECSWRWESVMRELVILMSGSTVSQAPVVRLDQLCLGEWPRSASGVPVERRVVLRRACCWRASSGP